MRKLTYHRFPDRDIDFEQRQRYYSDLPYFVRVMAGMDGKFGMFITQSPVKRGKRIQAKREIWVEVVTNGVDFSPLNYKNVDGIIVGVEPEGRIDFKVNLVYSYLDGKYNRIPFKGDTFLVRASLDNDVLTLQINHAEGPGRTECGRLADTIIEELRSGR